jgi:hypothetical protein
MALEKQEKRPVAEKGEHIIARHLIEDDYIKEEKNLVIDWGRCFGQMEYIHPHEGRFRV